MTLNLQDGALQESCYQKQCHQHHPHSCTADTDFWSQFKSSVVFELGISRPHVCRKPYTQHAVCSDRNLWPGSCNRLGQVVAGSHVGPVTCFDVWGQDEAFCCQLQLVSSQGNVKTNASRNNRLLNPHIKCNQCPTYVHHACDQMVVSIAISWDSK